MDKGKWGTAGDSTEKFKSFMENNLDAISIVDLEGKTLQVNAAFEEFFGWTNDELIGMPFPIIPDFLKESVNELHDQIKAGVQKKGFETVRLRKDGQLIDVSISCLISAIMKMSRAHWFSFIGILRIKTC
ncbi:PAS domain S-box protein [[Brevibacterium] frigoritolerans]|uniref:PAS domain S-box protein n=1 Tax=Peribacillus frigoritolerans TaxID=450367 RepID=A0A941J6L2_9BACI|nr:PAS domain S-box protein [Peribacillus frigoritolerans]